MKMLVEIRQNKKNRLFTWLVCTIICFVIENIFSPEAFYYDSWDYWNRGARYWEWTENGTFLFVSSDGARGYVFPLFLGVCNHFIGIFGWKLLNAMMISVLFTIIIPYLSGYKNDSDKFRVDYKAIILYFLFSFLFIGLEIYPLSDLPAIFLCGLAVCVILQMLETNGMKRFVYSVIGGILIYSAYNVRTIYLFGAIYMLFYLVYLMYRNHTKIKNVVLTAMGGVLGLLIAMFPQAYMNYCLFGRISVKVPTGGLMQSQLYWGIKYQNFAGYIGSDSSLESTLYFLDKVGINILQNEGIEGGLSLGQYISICIRYPFEMISVYGRHFINGILLYGPEIYIDELGKENFFVSIISFTCFFCLLLAFLSDCIKKWKTIWSFAPIIIPVICIIPGAIESRFFAALYLYIIGTLCYNCDWIKMINVIRKNKAKIGICYVGLYTCFLVVWTSMFANLDAGQSIFFSKTM